MTAIAASPIGTDPLAVLKDQFGFGEFRPGQRTVVDAILAGTNTLAVMPTGAGKSLCFQLPALMRPGFAVVVSPLIALMENQVAALRGMGIGAGMIHSGRDRALNVADWKAAVAGEAKLLYMSPERLTTMRMVHALKSQRVSLLVVDEAHCISQWGHHFRQEYLSLGGLKKHFPKTPMVAFTATADHRTRTDIVDQLFAGDAKAFVQGFDRPNISISIREKAKGTAQLEAILRRRRGEPGIVYCRSRKSTEQTANILSAIGHNAYAYHAGLSEKARADVLGRFMERDDVVVCATVAFGMGIDKPNIRYVIHRDLPASIEAYYQEIGRAGRDGRPADAILLYGIGDLIVRRKMADNSSAPEEFKRLEREKLDQLAALCDAKVCRRNLLLSYFGEERSDVCGRCDVCTSKGSRKAA
ncbi:MAG: ATP-dependent DNA helicase RecQ [Pseudomonadota bacterium]